MSLYDDSNHMIKNSPFAWWEWDVAKNIVQYNDLKVTMLGYDPNEFKNKG